MMKKFQLLEIYTDNNPISVTNLGFFSNIEDARNHLEDFLHEEVLQIEEGTECDLAEQFAICKGKTVYVNDDNTFEWHILEIEWRTDTSERV